MPSSAAASAACPDEAATHEHTSVHSAVHTPSRKSCSIRIAAAIAVRAAATSPRCRWLMAAAQCA
ncbi:hypothetical protein L2C96_33720 [Amycolatopsis tucumanensis]|nr:hypothetical protein [Amycolatopsis tucumanensis]MCF6427234.1 hypothetical protein [Amycolatopsis tucumanensis]